MSNRVVLITGSSRGVGREIARSFAMAGYKIVINYCNNIDAARETVNALRKNFPESEAVFVKADVTKESDVKRMTKHIINHFGKIDVLINNAGIHKNAVSWKMDKEIWDRVLAVNLTGAFLCIKHVIPIMRENGWGRIINISSVLGQTGTFGGCNYSASKAGLFGLTKSIAREVAHFNITVNCVVFGYADTGMSHALPRKIIDSVIEHTLLKRLATPEEFANLVYFLCTKKASYITGQTVHVNGGLYV